MNTSILFAIILLSPLLGFLFNGLRWKSKNYKLAGIVATLAVSLSFIASLSIVLQLIQLPADARSISHSFFTWIDVARLKVDVKFVIDQISAIMVLVVTGIASLIHLFSIGYMSHDTRPSKYFAYLNLFVFNMLLLILGDNLLVMFVGWEGVGLCSYLLIGFWFKDSDKAAAGMKAFITNRVGDAGLLIGIFILFSMFGTLSVSELLTIGDFKTELTMGWLSLACLALFIGATGKSAQIPLYVWLPDAMAGPTPVSALIHAATMVTAGIYMIVRLNPIFMAAPVVMEIIAIVGALTAFVAASIGLTQWDIKKVLAYSTVSQLGYMFLALGVGAFNAALFHVMTHAFFKALMFLGSGSVIHAMSEEQDIRKMGGLAKYLPITHTTFFLGWVAIIGLPPLAGFFSKDEILMYTFASPMGSKLLWFVGLLTAGMTAFYMTRLMCLTFWGQSRVAKNIHPHESPLPMTIPLIVLAVLSVVGGWIGIPHVISAVLPGHIPNVLEHWLQPKLTAIPNFQLPSASIEWALMATSVLLASAMAYLAYFMYVKKPGSAEAFTAKIQPVYNFVYNKYFVDEAYFAAIINPIVDLSKNLWAYVDVGFIDKITYFITDFMRDASNGIRNLQNGNVQRYALYIVLGIILGISFLKLG